MSALTGPDVLSAAERSAVEALVFPLADDEFVIAERYTEWQVRAPTLESDLALANVAQDEFGHARLWYDVVADLGYDEPELLFEREPDEFYHASLCALPFDAGDWADAVVRSYLYDTAEALRLGSLAGSAYAPIANRIERITTEEEYHREHATTWIERLCVDAEGRQTVQNAVDRLYPYALALFEPGTPEQTDAIESLNLRTESLPSLREQWIETTSTFFESIDVSVPVVEPLPEDPGRHDSHVEAWLSLYEEFTRTYRELDRAHTPTITSEHNDG